MSLIVHVIICEDGTDCWRSSATRCDVFVDCRVVQGVAMNGVTKPGNWSTWWALDGCDSKEMLLNLDLNTSFKRSV